MGDAGNCIKLYTAQDVPVVEAIKRDGTCFNKEAYIKSKYEESAKVFLTAYKWFSKEAQAFVPKPLEADFPYWAFTDLYNLGPGDNVLTLLVPADEVILFDMFDWSEILCLKYLGEDIADREAFQEAAARQGIKNESDIMLTSFYPLLKQQVTKSWSRLFRHHESIRAGNRSGVRSVQAALWQIKEEWIQP